MTRPTVDEWAMSLAVVTALRTTCLKRQVGAVLLDRRNHVLATGYNGVASGLPHCNEVAMVGVDYRQFGPDPSVQKPDRVVPSHPHACHGARMPEGSGGQCQALHAEWNALLQCSSVYAVETCYVTTAPCEACVKMLLGTSCRRVVFLDLHDSADRAQALWSQAGRFWDHLTITPFIRSHQSLYKGVLPRPLP